MKRTWLALLVGIAGLAITGGAAVKAQQPGFPFPVSSNIGRDGPSSFGFDGSSGPQRQADVRVPPAPQISAPADLSKRQVLFRRVSIEGATVFSGRDFDSLFVPILNRRVAMSEVLAAANAIALRYAQEGYVLCSVVLPNQDLNGDQLRVVVVEGFVSRVVFGDGIQPDAVKERINDVLKGIVGKRPLKRAELERRLLIAADTPGLVLRSGLSAEPQVGPVVLVVDGTFQRFTPIAQVDSFGTTPTTFLNFRFGGIGRSLLVGGDSLELRYIFALPWDRLHFGELRYGVPVGNDGGRLDFVAQGSWQRPPTTFNGQPVSLLGQSLLARVQYSQPIFRRPTWNLFAFGMLDVIEVDYRFQGIHVPGDSLRVLRGGISGTFSDDLNGAWTTSLMTSFGLDLGDAQANARAGATPGFVKFNASVERQQPLAKSVTVITRATAQLATGSLPVSEVFSFGGREFGRGFVVADSVGDHGIALSAEVRYAPDWLNVAKSMVDPYAYAFVDYGHLWSIDPANRPYFSSGASVGLGLHARLFEKVSGEVEIAKIVAGRTSATTIERPWRFSFRLGAAF